MGRLAPLILGAWSALQLLGAVAQDVPACIPGCANQLRSEFAKFSCKSAGDAACLCLENNFVYGVRDCGAHCGANDANVHQFLLGSCCAGQFSSSAASSTPQPTTPTSATPVSTPATASSASTASAASSSTASAASSAAATATSTTAASTTSTTASQTSTSPTATETAAAATDTPPASLSQASVVGIGVGVGAAVIALAGIVICLLLRSRKRTTHRSMQISKPLPGSGRTYPGRDHNSFEKYRNDIELTTNRYEDMVPRQQPRTLV